MHRSKMTVLVLFLLPLAMLLSSVGPAPTAPIYGEQWELRQPDGSTVTVRIWGDEYYQVVESLDGYTLVRDPATGVICYARLSPNGANLVSTGVRVGSVDPASLGIGQHIRITRESRAFQVRQKRETALYGIGPNGGPAATPPPATGAVLGLVLIVDFDDNVATIPAADVDRFCNDPSFNDNGNASSIRDYFYDISDGLLDYTSWVMPSYHRASKLFSYYDDCDTNVAWLSRGKELIVEILDSLETAGHDFSVYDSNSDGYIDAINLFYAGSTGCGWTRGLWPGSGSIADLWSADGVKTGRYQITGMGPFLTIGTYCHENGHMVCYWPDLYDYDGDSRGVGRWCLMASQYGMNPQEPCGYLKTTVGWATPTVINSDQSNIPLGPSSNNANLLKFPGPAANEYYLLENRGHSPRDANLPDQGIEIMHVDENGDHNANEMLPDMHFLVTIVQADGDWDLENDVNSGDSGDLWHNAPSPSFSICTDPATNWWDGSASEYHFNNFSAAMTNMTFDFSIGDSIPQALCKSYAEDPGTDCCITVDVDDIDNGSYDANGPGDIKSLLITHVDGSPVTPASSVQVCGDGLHTVTLTITDLCDNSTSCDAQVEVINDPPVALCKSYSDEADSVCCIWVRKTDIDNGSYDPDGAGDIKSFGITAVDGNPTGSVLDSVQVCEKGWHTVTLTITDWCDSTSSCDADVEVIDVTPPEMEITLNRDMLWPPNHKYSEIVASIEVTDNCDPNPTFVLTSVSSSEPDNDRGDGNTVNDVADTSLGTPDTTIALRSERRGGGDGRKYTIRWTATDNCGNSRIDSACVWVPHDQSGVAMGSYGFTSEGLSIQDGAKDVAVFFLSVPPTSVSWRDPTVGIGGWDATKMDPMQIYVGNTIGAIRPTWSQEHDINLDGLTDLMVTFPAERVRALMDATNTVSGGSVKVKGRNKPETIGIHYIGPEDEPHLVGNIFALGEPVYPRIIKWGETYEPEEDTPSKPKSLVTVYPNPFNPATTIDFYMAANEHALLSVYDVNGRLVRVLHEGVAREGVHSVRWDGTDSRGVRVTSGIYFTRFITPSHEMTRKMILLK